MSSFHPLLNSHPNLRMKNCESVLSKLDCMSKVGTAHLMIMADFDYTITKRWSDKDKNITCPSTFDVIKRSSLIDKKCAEEMKALFLKYWPIETNPNMSIEEKTPYISEWINAEITLMKQCGLTKKKLATMLATHGLILRDDFPAFCAKIREAAIPFIISTAGLADVVEGALEGWNLLDENISIIGNRFAWDSEDGMLLSFQDTVVHTLNKEVSMRSFFKENCEDVMPHEGKTDAAEKWENYSSRRMRQNIILLGDSLGDVRMTLDLGFAKNVLKIGFLNDKNPESKLEAFLTTYDIVLINEDAMNVPLNLLKMICDIHKA